MMVGMARDDHLAKDAMDALDAVWMSGDVPAILDCFEPDLVFFGSGDGEEAVGHTELAAMLEMLAPPAESGTFRVDWDALTAERLADFALVRGVGRVRSSGFLARFDGTAYRVTGILIRRDGTWRWRVYHGSEPASW